MSPAQAARSQKAPPKHSLSLSQLTGVVSAPASSRIGHADIVLAALAHGAILGLLTSGGCGLGVLAIGGAPRLGAVALNLAAAACSEGHKHERDRPNYPSHRESVAPPRRAGDLIGRPPPVVARPVHHRCFVLNCGGTGGETPEMGVRCADANRHRGFTAAGTTEFADRRPAQSVVPCVLSVDAKLYGATSR